MKTLLSLLLIAPAALAQSFPTSIFTPLVAKDNVQSALNATMAPGDNVAVLVSGTGWVTNSVAYICDTTTAGVCTGTYELMLVTNVAGNILTVTRGYGGTSGIAHAKGKIVALAVSSIYNTSLTNEIHAVETALGANMVNVPAINYAVPWPSLATIFDSARVAINNYPIGAEFGANTVGAAQGLVGAIDVPVTSVSAIHSTGVSGYARTASSTTNAVGVFGLGGLTADNTGGGISAWGGNVVAQNCDGTTSCSGSNGFNGINLYGLEADVNVIPRAGGIAPGGNAVGLFVIGGSRIQPTGLAQAIQIGQMGTFDNIGWKDGIYLVDGAATATGINIGTSATGNGVGSMPLALRSRTAGGTNNTANIFADALGNLQIQPSSTSWVVLTDGGLHAALTVQPSGTTPFVSIAYKLMMSGAAQFANGTTTFASLGSPANGTQIYCSDCNTTCTAGGGTGRTCFRENGAWIH